MNQDKATHDSITTYFLYYHLLNLKFEKKRVSGFAPQSRWCSETCKILLSHSFQQSCNSSNYARSNKNFFVDKKP